MINKLSLLNASVFPCTRILVLITIPIKLHKTGKIFNFDGSIFCNTINNTVTIIRICLE